MSHSRTQAGSPGGTGPSRDERAAIEQAAAGVRVYIRVECGALDHAGRIAALTLAIADELAADYGNAPARLATAVHAVESGVRSLTRGAAHAVTAPAIANSAR